MEKFYVKVMTIKTIPLSECRHFLSGLFSIMPVLYHAIFLRLNEAPSTNVAVRGVVGGSHEMPTAAVVRKVLVATCPILSGFADMK